MNKRRKVYGREVSVTRFLHKRHNTMKDVGRHSLRDSPIRSGTSNRGGGGDSSNFLKLALTTGVVLSFAIIFFVFNTFGETKINVTITSNPDLNRGLVGHWTFDGPDMTSNVADTSGNGNTGYLNGFTSTTTVPGKIGQALSFDGVDDVVDLSTVPLSTFTSNFSVSIWFKADKYNTSIVDIVGTGSVPATASNKVWILRVTGGNTTQTGNLVFRSNAVGGTDTSADSGFSVTTNTWYNVVVLYDATTGSSTVYLNGVKGNDNTVGTGGFNTGGLDLSLNYSTRDFDGQMDDARVYNRILSAKEVKRLYQQGATTYLNKTLATDPNLNNGLVGYWTFDGVLNTQITDQSGNGNTGYFGASSNATNTLPTIGKIGQAVKFDGVGDNMVVGNGVLNQTEPNGFSAFMWLKSSETTNGRYFFERGGSGSFTVQAQSSGNAYCRIRNSAGTFLGTPSALVLDGEWHHVGCSFSTTTKAFTMYVDGASTTSKSAVAFDKFIDNATWFSIGGRNGGNYAKGSYDDFRIYNRSLSATEVKRLYQQGATTYINKTIASSPDLNNGLVGHWTFDGPDLLQNVADSSGNGNTGYLKGFTSTTTAPGKIGQALEFDFEGTGGNRYIDLGSASSLDDIDTQGGGGISGSMWLNHKRPGSAGANQAWFISKDIFPSTSSGGWQFNFRTQSLPLRFRKSFSTTVLEVVTANGVISNNKWYYIAFTWDGSSNASGVHIYVDGTEVSSYQIQIDGVGTKNSDASNTLYIGSAVAGPKDLQGTVDDVRLYNKVLTPDEISRLYQLGGGN